MRFADCWIQLGQVYTVTVTIVVNSKVFIIIFQSRRAWLHSKFLFNPFEKSFGKFKIERGALKSAWHLQDLKSCTSNCTRGVFEIIMQ